MLSKIVSSTDTIPPQGLLFDPLIVNDFLQQEDAERLNAELAGEGGGGHAGQQVDHEELGEVQDATATNAEYSQKNAQEMDERDIGQDTTDGQPEEAEEPEEQASSLSVSLPPPPLPFPPPRGTGRIRKQRNKFN